MIEIQLIDDGEWLCNAEHLYEFFVKHLKFANVYRTPVDESTRMDVRDNLAVFAPK